MLFPYVYVPHQMERMQRFINYIFYQVWCRAPKAGPYDLALFDQNPPLKEVMTSFAYGHTEVGDRFCVQIQTIYESFSVLPRKDIAQFKRWYQGNNNIGEICSNGAGIHIIRYNDISTTYQALTDQLRVFFKSLYSQDLLDLAALCDKIGKINDHYKTFVAINKLGICPFCGIGSIKSAHFKKREAYDHYLPKSIYPFNSINFRNLAPACHECNSSYKLTKDPAHNGVGRRKAFYPYSDSSYLIELDMTLQHCDIDNLTPGDVDFQFGPAVLSEEIDTWKELYGIEERYKARLCGEYDGKYWVVKILDEWKEDGKHPDEFLNTLTRQAQKWPHADENFLKKSFFDACRTAGLF